jgi:hypothetical protein
MKAHDYITVVIHPRGYDILVLFFANKKGSGIHMYVYIRCILRSTQSSRFYINIILFIEKLHACIYIGGNYNFRTKWHKIWDQLYYQFHYFLEHMNLFNQFFLQAHSDLVYWHWLKYTMYKNVCSLNIWL